MNANPGVIILASIILRIWREQNVSNILTIVAQPTPATQNSNDIAGN